MAQSMDLVLLDEDALGAIFEKLRNKVNPRDVVVASSTCKRLRGVTKDLVQKLQAEYKEVTAYCIKAGIPNCKVLREVQILDLKNPSVAEMALIGTLFAVLPVLKKLAIIDGSVVCSSDRISQLVEGLLPSTQQLLKGLVPGALPAVTDFALVGLPVGNAGAKQLGAALDLGALPRLKNLVLNSIYLSPKQLGSTL